MVEERERGRGGWEKREINVHCTLYAVSLGYQFEFVFSVSLGSHLLLQDRCCPGCGCYTRRSTCCHHDLPRSGYSSNGQEECHREELALCGDSWLYLGHLL